MRKFDEERDVGACSTTETCQTEKVSIVTSLWALVMKKNKRGELVRLKAQLAIRGFLQKYGIDYLATNSLVVRIEPVRLVLILALMLGLDCRHVGFVTALLNGELTEVYQKAIDGTNRVCRLLKELMEKLASKIWNDKLHAYLMELKFN